MVVKKKKKARQVNDVTIILIDVKLNVKNKWAAKYGAAVWNYAKKHVFFIIILSYFNIIIEEYDLELWARLDVFVRRIIHVSDDMYTSRGRKKKHRNAKTSRVLDFHKLSSHLSIHHLTPECYRRRIQYV